MVTFVCFLGGVVAGWLLVNLYFYFLYGEE
jgi:hypothetical protein